MYTNGDREPSFRSAGQVTWNVATFLVINGSDMVDIYGKMTDQSNFTMEMILVSRAFLKLKPREHSMVA